MKSIGKNFTTKGIENLIAKFPDIKIQDKIQDKPRRVKQFHYCQSQPKPRHNPELSGLSKNVIELLGYDFKAVEEDQNTPLYLSGSKLIPGSLPIAHNYCGYQFGVWADQLGDGRAHTLGTVKNEGQIYQLQLKGSGKSPFSRHADGNSVVSSAVRQFLASQLMYGLQIPTTRAASLVITEEDVARDPFYDGRIKIEKAAVVMRTSPSFLRIGSFQVCNKSAQMDTGDMFKNRQILEPLANYLHQNFYPHIDENQCDIYEGMFEEIVKKNAELVAHWQAKGFVHGVMNTDNISLLGLTIDYGPFGFIDYFSKDFVSNATDQHERYSYRQQPKVMKWNLLRLADSFDIFVPKDILYECVEENFDKIYTKKYYDLMCRKLGLSDNPKSIQIIDELLDIMHICSSNFTNTFRILNQITKQSVPQSVIPKLLLESLPTPYYLKNLRAFPNLKEVDKQQIEQIQKSDQSFNVDFILEQDRRIQMKNILETQSCQERTKRESQIWKHWLQNYITQQINQQIRNQNTIQYTLLNETAKTITEQLMQLHARERRELLNKILEVFDSPYKNNEWFEEKYWKKRAIPVRLTCSS